MSACLMTGCTVDLLVFEFRRHGSSLAKMTMFQVRLKQQQPNIASEETDRMGKSRIETGRKKTVGNQEQATFLLLPENAACWMARSNPCSQLCHCNSLAAKWGGWEAENRELKGG